MGGFGAGLFVGRFDVGVLLGAGFVTGVCDLPTLEGGLSAGIDIAEEVRDIDVGWETLAY